MLKYIISIVSAIVLIGLILFSQNYFSYKECLIIEEDSYLILDDNLYLNLRSGSESKIINYLYANNNLKLYQNMDNLYIFNPDKVQIDSKYPIVNKSKITNIFYEVTLIDEEFNHTILNNFIIKNNKLYDYETLSRIDNHNYILMKLYNNLIINPTSLIVDNNMIMPGSILLFNDRELRYYEIIDGTFTYNKITINEKTNVKINNNKYLYKELYQKIQG